MSRPDAGGDQNPDHQGGEEHSRKTSGLLDAMNRQLAIGITVLLCLSGMQFCLYIVLRYLAPLLGAEPDQWHLFAPGFSNGGDPVATTSLVLHLVAGVIVMVLGCVQFVTVARRRWPVVHRVIGRAYVSSAMLAAVGGLGYIVLNGTVGGAVMDLGFGLYGVLVLVAAVRCLRHARARDVAAHRDWAVRLFVLVVASWLYRLEYGVAGVLGTGGHTPQFTGWFDQMMAFAFYVPNLLIAEMYLRARRRDGSIAWRTASLLALSVAAAVVVIGVYSRW
ncbi:DUF2306 domain-containing protein [Mycolicibacterium wolinskyi]|nr:MULTISPECIES: DUF2306 domain-containing protein [Mycolicibacterium]MCV7287869.1 DUF2306 domain-containing protein [Mycolicibacterium wolinskyi]MCV7294767.1 DUF2306 domain-containing protein [Mycolicibacterium goodii]